MTLSSQKINHKRTVIWTGLYPLSMPFIRYHYEFLSRFGETWLIAKNSSKDKQIDPNILILSKISNEYGRFKVILNSFKSILLRPMAFLSIPRLNDLKYIGIHLSIPTDDDTVHLVEFGTDVFLPLILRRMRIIFGSIIVHFHGHDLSSRVHTDRKYRKHLSKTLSHIDGIIVVSEWQRDYLIHLGASPSLIQIIPCGAKIPETVNVPVTGSCEFSFVGRLTEGKGIIESLRAFRYLVEHTDAEIFLNIVGNGYLRNQAGRIVEDTGLQDLVKFWGKIPHDKVFDILRKTSVFVLHSKTASNGWKEGWCIAIAEASAMGLPVVATNHGGIPDHQIDGKTAFLVPEGDWKAMGERMVQLAGSPDLRKRMGAAGRAHIIEVGNIDIQLRKLSDYIESVRKEA